VFKVDPDKGLVAVTELRELLEQLSVDELKQVAESMANVLSGNMNLHPCHIIEMALGMGPDDRVQI